MTLLCALLLPTPKKQVYLYLCVPAVALGHFLRWLLALHGPFLNASCKIDKYTYGSLVSTCSSQG